MSARPTAILASPEPQPRWTAEACPTCREPVHYVTDAIGRLVPHCPYCGEQRPGYRWRPRPVPTPAPEYHVSEAQRRGLARARLLCAARRQEVRRAIRRRDAELVATLEQHPEWSVAQVGRQYGLTASGVYSVLHRLKRRAPAAAARRARREARDAAIVADATAHPAQPLRHLAATHGVGLTHVHRLLRRAGVRRRDGRRRAEGGA